MRDVNLMRQRFQAEKSIGAIRSGECFQAREAGDVKVRHQFRVVTAALVAVSVVALALVLARAQAPKGTAERTKWTQTKTPWGDPDLQGVWSGTTPTPLERPLAGGKVLLTDQEVESLEQELARRFEAPRPGDPGAYNAF